MALALAALLPPAMWYANNHSIPSAIILRRNEHLPCRAEIQFPHSLRRRSASAEPSWAAL